MTSLEVGAPQPQKTVDSGTGADTSVAAAAKYVENAYHTDTTPLLTASSTAFLNEVNSFLQKPGGVQQAQALWQQIGKDDPDVQHYLAVDWGYNNYNSISDPHSYAADEQSLAPIAKSNPTTAGQVLAQESAQYLIDNQENIAGINMQASTVVPNDGLNDNEWTISINDLQTASFTEINDPGDKAPPTPNEGPGLLMQFLEMV